MGHRTHATALHSISLIKSQMEFDPVLRQQLAQIRTTVGK
jgi:chromosomal replication initiation ATPase DnaA